MRALRLRSRTEQLEALDDLAEKLLEACENGEMEALKELGNRLDGKAVQQIAATDTEGRPLAIALVTYNTPQLPAAPLSITDSSSVRLGD